MFRRHIVANIRNITELCWQTRAHVLKDSKHHHCRNVMITIKSSGIIQVNNINAPLNNLIILDIVLEEQQNTYNFIHS